MAKKRKKEKEEGGYEFKMPEFDEEEYLKKEVRDARALFVTFGYAVTIGLVSFGLTLVDIALAALVGFIAIVFLRHIYSLVGVDTTSLEKKQWGGNIIMYIFTWLAVWILLSNPPFSDIADPTIKEDAIYFGDSGNWTRLNDTNRDEIPIGTNISINVTIVDNVKVDEDTIRITVKRSEEEITPSGGDHMKRIGKNRYAYVFPANPQQKYDYSISVSDVNNHKAIFTRSIQL